MDEKIREILGQLRSRFEAIYGERLVKMVLYGSHARGEARAESDIDILVVLRGPVDPGEEVSLTGKTAASLSLEHDLVISCAFVSDERYAGEGSPFLMNVRREGVTV